MFPVIFSFGNFILYSFGFWVAIGLVVAAFSGWKRLVDLGLEEEKVLDLLLLMIFWGIIGGRLVHIVENFAIFGFSPLRWASLIKYPGLSVWGGLFFASVYVFFFTKRNKWDFWQIADELVFAIASFLFFAWIGVFFDGSVLGKQTGMPWGIFYHGNMIRRFPVALFFSVGILFTWGIVSSIQRTWRGWGWLKDKRPGLLAIVFAGCLSLLNFSLAFITDIDLYFFLAEIIISLLIFIFVCASLFLRTRSKRG